MYSVIYFTFSLPFIGLGCHFIIIVPSYFFSFLFLYVILCHLFCFLLFLLFSLPPFLSFVFHYLHHVFSTSDFLFLCPVLFPLTEQHCCLRSRVDMFYARKRVLIAMFHQTFIFCPPSQSDRQDIFAYLTAFCSCFHLCTFPVFVLQPPYDIFQKQLFCL